MGRQGIYKPSMRIEGRKLRFKVIDRKESGFFERETIGYLFFFF